MASWVGSMLGFGGSTTTTMEPYHPPGTSSSTTPASRKLTVEEMADEDIPSFDQLLVAMDTAERSAAPELRETVKAVVRRAQLDEVEPAEYLKYAILVGFRRRNHEKALASGTGAGEKRVLRSILAEIAATQPELVQAVLPLVPIYGCWRDLQVLVEEFGDESPEMVEEVAAVFAKQLKADLEVLESKGGKAQPKKRKRKAGEEKAEGEEEEESTVSSAAKYCPHEHRHRGSKKRAKKADPESDRVVHAKAQSHCSHTIATRMGLRPTHLSADLRKEVLAPLNRYLTDMGFLVEPHLCLGEPAAINFFRAPKGALIKYKKAIEKNPAAARKWKRSMAVSASAVPDIEDLREVSVAFRDEEGCDPEDCIVPMRVAKAITTAKARRAELVEKAERLLKQVNASEEMLKSLGEEDAIHTQALMAIHDTITLIIADVAHTTDAKAMSILISAFVMSKAQGPSAMVVNVDYGQHVVLIDAEWTLNDFISHVEELGNGAMEPNMGVKEIRHAVTSVLQAHHDCIEVLQKRADAKAAEEPAPMVAEGGPTPPPPEPAAELRMPKLADVLLLCAEFEATSEEGGPEALNELIAELPTLCPVLPARTLLVHRMRGSAVLEGALPLKPRQLRPRKPVKNTQVDVVFFMDLTGSMGSYMDAAKRHLTDIIGALQSETSVGGFRVGFVGYRDYRDNGRVVHSPLVPMDEASKVVDDIQKQGPSGGGDMPEDVLSGVEQLRKMAWKGDYRFVVHVADAPAHGYCDTPSWDDYPSGRCPDQKIGLPESVAGLKNDCGVDYLLCELNASTNLMRDFLHNLYGEAGFGVAPMSMGASQFKDVIVGALSASILSAMTDDVTTCGVQTFDGSTLSATISTLNASMKESLHHVSGLYGPKKLEPVVSDAAEDMDDSEEPAKEEETGKEEEEVAAEEGGAEEKETAPAEKATVKESKVVGRSDKSRLMAELEGDDLGPVRLALRMSVTDSLLVESAKVLLKAGVTVPELEANGYPEAVVSAMREAAGAMLRRL